MRIALTEPELAFKTWIHSTFEDDPPADIALKLRAAFLAGWNRPKGEVPKLIFEFQYDRCVQDYADYRIKAWMDEYGLPISQRMKVVVEDISHA